MGGGVLITVSGTIPRDAREDALRGARPRPDYDRLAAAMDGDLIDHAAARQAMGRLGRLVARVGGDTAVLALACFRRRRDYAVVFTDSEKVGFLFAALCRVGPRRARHVMIAHRLSPKKKRVVHQALGLRRRIDHVLVYADAQRRFAVDRLGYAPERVTLTPFMVDTAFWNPAATQSGRRDRPLVAAAGRELRDYPTLLEAVRGLDIDVVVAPASPWSKRADSSAGTDVPANVEVTPLGPVDLRQLYSDATVVAMPLVETDFQAGITAILEAMAMGRAVVCTKTTGQTDTIVDGVTGVYVDAADPPSMRSAIESLLADTERRETIGEAGRRWVIEHADIDVYATRLAAITAQVAGGR
jgi:glycosyltransferase involved in cell wall biosynthesis